MASTVNELKTRLEYLLNNSGLRSAKMLDKTTNDMLLHLLDHAETQFYRDELARIPPLQKSVSGFASAGTTNMTYPEDYTSLNYLSTTVEGKTVSLARVSIDTMIRDYTDNAVSIPTCFAADSYSIRVPNCSSDVTYTMYYYGTLTPLLSLDDDTQQNHFLLNFLDDYLLYTAAIEACNYLRSTDIQQMKPLWTETLAEIRERVKAMYQRQLFSGTKKKMVSAYSVPKR